MRRLRPALCAALVVSALGVALAAGPSRAATKTDPTLPPMVLTMFADPEDFVTGGVSQEFDVTNATFGGTLSTAGIDLTVAGGTDAKAIGFGEFTFVADPPRGQTLHPGTYSGIESADLRAGNHPGLDIDGDGRGCDSDAGYFDIRDLASTGTTITRLDLIYEQHCDQGQPAMFGELRVGEPDGASPIVSSTAITWPESVRGAATIEAPIWVRNPSASRLRVGTAAISGPSAADFTIVTNRCNSKVLPTNGACEIFVRFKGASAGPATASMALPLDGTDRLIQLDADVPAGTTALMLVSQPGDPVGNGADYEYLPSKDTLDFTASPQGFALSVLGANVLDNTGEQNWSVDIFPAQGRILAPGTYRDVSRYPYQGKDNGLDVSGDGVGCNSVSGSFTIHQAEFSAVDDSLLHFSATFVQTCGGFTAPLTGTVKYDAEPVTADPPAVSDLHASEQGTTATIAWANPATGSAYTVVRLEQASPAGVSPVGGLAAYEGKGTSATIATLRAGVAYVATAFTVDRYGNVSLPVTVPIGASS